MFFPSFFILAGLDLSAHGTKYQYRTLGRTRVGSRQSRFQFCFAMLGVTLRTPPPLSQLHFLPLQNGGVRQDPWVLNLYFEAVAFFGVMTWQLNL